VHFAKAHELRPEAALAERAAYALRACGGDLHRAAALGEQAVNLEPNNAACLVTLGEIYLAANLVTRARTVSARAAELVPTHPRVKDLVAAVAKKTK
jgi:hypothetical protein